MNFIKNLLLLFLWYVSFYKYSYLLYWRFIHFRGRQSFRIFCSSLDNFLLNRYSKKLLVASADFWIALFETTLRALVAYFLWCKEAFVYTLCPGFESLCSIEYLIICFHYRKRKANHSIFSLYTTQFWSLNHTSIDENSEGNIFK